MYLVITDHNVHVSNKQLDELLFENNEFSLFINGIHRKAYNIDDPKIIDEIIKEFSHDNISKYIVGGYFILFYDKQSKIVKMIRDRSGIKTGYYHFASSEATLHVSTNMHDIAKNINTDFSELYVDFFLYQSYLPNGYTFYENILEIKVGECLSWNLKNNIKDSTISSLPINYEENNYSEQENIDKLRELTLSVHEELAGEFNTVYLSGGIDSCAMLAALYNVCPGNIRNISYRVKNTSQDETSYAKIVAKHLGYNVDIIDIDPNDEGLVDDFENEIMSYNNPYIGNWIFKPVTKNANERFFAGQDTRLHTPSIDRYDEKVFSYISQGKNVSESLLLKAYEYICKKLNFLESDNRKIRNSHLVASLLQTEKYIYKRKFHCDRLLYHAEKYRMKNFDKIKEWYQIELSKGMTKREINNRIVSKKWEEQYINDIRYMVDMGRFNNVTTLMPFYQEKINLFSSTIPWNLANKKMEGLDGFNNTKVKVNKFVLRKAFEKELPHSIMVRNKSVSLTTDLLLNGALGKKIKNIIKDDINSSDSFCHRFELEEHANKIIFNNKWKMSDNGNFPVYLASLCIYYRKNILKRN